MNTPATQNPGPIDWPARDDALYRDLFLPRAEGFMGADGIISVPVSPERVVWIFGDTLVGRMQGERRVHSAMPRNSIAIQDLSHGAPGKVSFHWGQTEAGDARSFFEEPGAAARRSWFWAGTAFMHEGQLVIIGYRVVEAKGPFEALDFKVQSLVRVTVSNPGEHPHLWRTQWCPVDLPSGAPSFCTAHYRDGGDLYLLGFQPRPGSLVNGFVCVLARVPMAELMGPAPGAAFEYWVWREGREQWSAQCEELVPLFSPGVSEAEVYYDAPRGRFVCTCYDTLSPLLLVTTAPALTGPWSPPHAIYEAPEHAGRDDVMSYALRMHPELAQGPDEMILTYVTNTRQIEQVLASPRFYYARFLRLDLRKVV